MEIDRAALEEWQKQQPLCILSLDPADRAVLRIAGRTSYLYSINVCVSMTLKCRRFSGKKSKAKLKPKQHRLTDYGSSFNQRCHALFERPRDNIFSASLEAIQNKLQDNF